MKVWNYDSIQKHSGSHQYKLILSSQIKWNLQPWAFQDSWRQFSLYLLKSFDKFLISTGKFDLSLSKLLIFWDRGFESNPTSGIWVVLSQGKLHQWIRRNTDKWVICLLLFEGSLELILYFGLKIVLLRIGHCRILKS